MNRAEIETLLTKLNITSPLGTRRTVAQVLETCNIINPEEFDAYTVACIAFQVGLERGRIQGGLK